MWFNFEKLRDYYRICIIAYLRKSSSCVRFLNPSDLIDTPFFWDGNRTACFFPKISHRNMQKNEDSLLHQKIQPNNFPFLQVITVFIRV